MALNIGPYELDNIYCGDSAMMLAALPDACVDLTVTSPPYDNLRAYNGFSWDFTAIATQLYRVTKPGGVVVWVVGDATVNGSETGSSFRQALGFMEIGFNLHDTMIYRRKTKPLNHNRYEQEFEYMFVFSRPGVSVVCNHIKAPSLRPGREYDRQTQRHRDENGIPSKNEGEWKTKDEKVVGNIWEYYAGNAQNGDKKSHDHPAIFPEALARDHILSWSNPGDIVLDIFAGSGTTAKMSKVLSRHWLGFDISQEYVDLANRRVAGANVPLPLFVEQPQPKPTQDTLL